MIASKSIIVTPEYYPVTPEYYPFLPTSKRKDTSIVKALFISERLDVAPQIITDSSERIISKLFPNTKPICIFSDRDYHIYLDPTDQIIGVRINFIATSFARMESYRHIYRGAGEQVCGNVLMFGSKNLETNTYDNKDHSVPFHIVEESLRLFDILQKIYPES